MNPIPVTFAEGTQRTVPPEATLAHAAPHLATVGVTRLADITGLDRLGIPTWCAIRPGALQVQISNGKGLTAAAAKASAVMEAVEHWHCENPATSFHRASVRELQQQGVRHLAPAALPTYRPGIFLTDERRIDWVEGESLPDGERVLLPACAAFVVEPQLAPHSTNGLASGNHPVEATLHGLYEVIERHAITELSRGGLSLPRGRSRVVNLASVGDGPVAALRDRLASAGVSLVLIRADSIAPVSTFWAVILDPVSPYACSRINMGHGSHLDGTIAATRAITEAAQSRLTFIHGAREDLAATSFEFSPAHRRLYDFFGRQAGELSWSEVTDRSSGDLSTDLKEVLAGLAAAGFDEVYRVDLTRPDIGIPVVKMVVPGLAYIDGFLGRHHDV